MRPRLLALAAAAVLAACAGPNVAINPRADFSKIERVAVLTFAGPRGDVAADLMTQHLVGRGATVIERQQLQALLREKHLAQTGILDPKTARKVGQILGVDALFMGTVARAKEAQSYVVTNARHNRQTRVTAVAGGTIVPGGSVNGVPDSQVVTSEASASMIARMVDVRTGTILWSANMADEGFDAASTMDEIADDFVASLAKAWKQLSNK